jgi:hypothetical protein
LVQLQNILTKQGAPTSITNAIFHGITQWIEKQTNPSLVQRTPTFGSLLSLDVAITQAYYEQTKSLGWGNLVRGRISKLCSKAYVMYQS